ncbi:hypothetical protein ACKWTF_002947 [Chironomus riparius]
MSIYTNYFTTNCIIQSVEFNLLYPTQTFKQNKKKFKMFKFVVLSCLVSVAFAGYVPASVAYEKTIVEPHVSVVETPTVSHVGSVVKSFPSATSYQSQTQYHSKTYAEPIYAHGVEKQVISTPIVKKVVEHVPVAKQYISEPYYAKQYVSEPAYSYAKSYVSEPTYYGKSYVSEPAYYAKSVVAEPTYYAKSYVAEPVKAYSYAASPLAYSAPVYSPKSYDYAAAYPSAYSYPSYANKW